MQENCCLVLVEQIVEDLLFTFEVNYCTAINPFVNAVRQAQLVADFHENQSTNNPDYVSFKWCLPDPIFLTVRRINVKGKNSHPLPKWPEGLHIIQVFVVHNVVVDVRFVVVVQLQVLHFVVVFEPDLSCISDLVLLILQILPQLGLKLSAVL